MDNLLQTIETKTLLPQEVDDLERSLKERRPNSSNLRDLTQLYAIALIYEEASILEVIHRYMLVQMDHGWYLDELLILQSFYQFTCRKQARQVVIENEEFVCQKFPPFSDLTEEQITLLKKPYLEYLNRPYVRKYNTLEASGSMKSFKKKKSTCCRIL